MRWLLPIALALWISAGAVLYNQFYSAAAPITGTQIANASACAACQPCGNWTSCIRGQERRTCYTCGPQTNFTCQQESQIRACVVPAAPPLKATDVLGVAAPVGVLIALAAGGYFLFRRFRRQRVSRAAAPAPAASPTAAPTAEAIRPEAKASLAQLEEQLDKLRGEAAVLQRRIEDAKARKDVSELQSWQNRVSTILNLAQAQAAARNAGRLAYDIERARLLLDKIKSGL